MNVIKTDFEGLLIIEPRVFRDNRGHFFESYNKKSFLEAGIDVEFVQDNQSFSQRGVIRGLHYQIPPHAQAKLVRVLSGTIQDVVVDLRKNQPTFSKHFSLELSAGNNRQLLVPAGFAHGFLVLSESAEVMYKCNKLYEPRMERGLLITDPALNIKWQLDVSKFIFSEKDTQYPVLANADYLFDE